MVADFQKVIAVLREAVSLSPDNIALRLHLAQTLLDADQVSEATHEYREILRQNPSQPGAKLGLGISLVRGNEPQQAIPVLQEVVRDEPQNAQALFWLAKAQRATGDTGAALKNFIAATNLDPTIASGSDFAPWARSQQVPDKAAEAPTPDDKLVLLSVTGDDLDELDLGSRYLEQVQVTFQDVGGLDELKEQIRFSIIYPFTHPEIFAAYGQKAGGGFLLYGPPGCGKTHIARATAGESKACFINVSINEVLDRWLGNSEKNIHAVFETARRHAPAIIFIDEIDALGGARLNVQHHYRTIVDQLLAEMDGLAGDNKNILVIGATNSPWSVDAAFRRPGRFDRVIFVPPPDEAAREAIFRYHTRNQPVEGVDFTVLARRSEGYSGADIMGICKFATEHAIRRAMRTGQIRPLTMDDFLTALRQCRPSINEWIATARIQATYSNESGLYTDLLNWLNKHQRF
jgi:transitional endoplasmic reticulum ATPase